MTKHTNSQVRWDEYFYDICCAVAKKSSCISRQIGAIIVRDKSIISTGFNGPARGFVHCNDLDTECRRRKMGLASGEGLQYCPAAYAETNAIVNAARCNSSTRDASLYLNTIIPCKDCMTLIVNAGIIEVIATDIEYYHSMSAAIAEAGGITIRRFAHLGG